MYSPRSPRDSIVRPPMKTSIAMTDVYPMAMPGCSSFLIMITDEKKSPATEKNVPITDTTRKGFSEKAVKPFIHNAKSFQKL